MRRLTSVDTARKHCELRSPSILMKNESIPSRCRCKSIIDTSTYLHGTFVSILQVFRQLSHPILAPCPFRRGKGRYDILAHSAALYDEYDRVFSKAQPVTRPTLSSFLCMGKAKSSTSRLHYRNCSNRTRPVATDSQAPSTRKTWTVGIVLQIQET